MRGILGAVLACLLWALPALALEEEGALWGAVLSGGHVVVMRHALAPGTGDPPEFRLGECGTQRNLSDDGRRQAVRIGQRLRENGIREAEVFSSQWCRCLETARLLQLGTVTELPALNSFFRRYERKERQTRELREWLAARDLGEPLVLVTHQVNITALTGVYPGSGEMVVLRRTGAGEFSVVGTIETD